MTDKNPWRCTVSLFYIRYKTAWSRVTAAASCKSSACCCTVLQPHVVSAKSNMKKSNSSSSMDNNCCMVLQPWAVWEKEKERKDYTFWRQFNENLSSIPGCPLGCLQDSMKKSDSSSCMFCLQCWCRHVYRVFQIESQNLWYRISFPTISLIKNTIKLCHKSYLFLFHFDSCFIFWWLPLKAKSSQTSLAANKVVNTSMIFLKNSQTSWLIIGVCRRACQANGCWCSHGVDSGRRWPVPGPDRHPG